MSLGVISVGALPPGSPHRASIKREMIHFQSLRERERERDRDAVFTEHSFTVSQVPSKGTATSMVPHQGPCGERCYGSRANGLFIHSYLSRIPSEGALPWNKKTSGHHPQNWMEGLCTVGCGLVPQGDHLRHCYYYPSVMQSSAQYLSGLDQQEHGSPCNCVVQTRGWIYGRQVHGILPRQTDYISH